MGVSYTNDIHPVWASEGCTGCHDSPIRPPVLTDPPATVCPVIRDGTTTNGPGDYLDNPACTADGSWIIRVPATGSLPNGNPHTGGGGGGAYPCFEAGGNCRDTILLWCTQANPPICP
jgi:hypothetical protein